MNFSKRSTAIPCVLFAILAGALAACRVAPLPPVLPPDPGDVPAAEESELFIPGGEPGEILFRTADSRYHSSAGFTLWGLDDEFVDPYRERETVCTRLAGHAAAGFGLVICHREIDDSPPAETMLAVMINIEGEYIVGEVIDDEFRPLTAWTECAALARGYNQDNRLRIECSGDGFLLTINGVETLSFRDDEAPYHTAGRNGWIVVLSPFDISPRYPVAELRFRELLP